MFFCLSPTGQHIEAVFPPMEDFLGDEEEDECPPPWMRLLIEHCYNQALAGVYQEEPMEV